MKVTTILTKIDGIGGPIAWLIHDEETKEHFSYFLDWIRKNCKNLRPSAVMGDFGPAMRSSVKEVLGIPYYGDLWHFIHSNIRWMQKNGGGQHVETLIPMVSALARSPDFDTWQQNYRGFIAYWIKTFASYVAYFKSQWIEKMPPIHWALFLRKPGAPTGDNILEAWHRRYKHLLEGKSNLPIDRLVDFLWKEWLYFKSILESDHLKEARKKELEEIGRKFAKRSTLKDYVTMTAIPSIQDIPSISVPTIEEITEERGNTNLVSLEEPMNTVAASVSEVWSTQEGRCQHCHSAKVNKQCTLSLCAKCCSQDERFCTLTSHIGKKIEIEPWKSYLVLLDDAMKDSTALFLRYSGGLTPGEIRGIRPKKWINRPTKFVAGCMNSNIDKTYLLSRVLSLELNQ